MSLRFATIASSSSGNCVYVGTENTNILIDAGLSGKKVEEGLSSLGLTGNDIDGIFVTHEHSDHVKEFFLVDTIFLFLPQRVLGAICRLP